MPYLSLSFDNGPDRDATPRVLATLARRDIKATFFVVGQKLDDPEMRALCARARHEGHWIGNHTFTHTTPLGELPTGAASECEIRRTEKVIGNLAYPEPLFRPYGGGGSLDQRLLNRSAVNYLVQHRYTCVLRNAVPRDWVDPHGWVERGVAQCLARDWTLMVLHDIPTGAMRSLDRFLGRAAESGVQFRQDFPPDCLPMRRGKVVLPIDSYISE